MSDVLARVTGPDEVEEDEHAARPTPTATTPPAIAALRISPRRVSRQSAMPGCPVSAAGQAGSGASVDVGSTGRAVVMRTLLTRGQVTGTGVGPWTPS